MPSFRTSFIISILTYISSLHVLGLSIRYPDLSKLHSLIAVIPGYGVPPKITKLAKQKDYQAFLILYFDIAGDPCNPIGPQQCDLFTNYTIFCSKSRYLRSKPRRTGLLYIASFLFRIQNEM